MQRKDPCNANEQARQRKARIQESIVSHCSQSGLFHADCVSLGSQPGLLPIIISVDLYVTVTVDFLNIIVSMDFFLARVNLD